jgi:hypothetical protein
MRFPEPNFRKPFISGGRDRRHSSLLLSRGHDSGFNLWTLMQSHLIRDAKISRRGRHGTRSYSYRFGYSATILQTMLYHQLNQLLHHWSQNFSLSGRQHKWQTITDLKWSGLIDSCAVNRFHKILPDMYFVLQWSELSRDQYIRWSSDGHKLTLEILSGAYIVYVFITILFIVE